MISIRHLAGGIFPARPKVQVPWSLTPATWVLDRLPFRYKFALIGGLVLVPFAVVTWMVLHEAYGAHNASALERKGVARIQELVVLLQDLQMHGLYHAAVLAGDQRFAELHESAHTCTNRRIGALVSTASRGELFDLTEDSVQAVDGAWRRIHSRVLNPRESIREHHRALQSLQETIAHVADVSGLSRSSDPESFWLAQIYTNTLPRLFSSFADAAMLCMSTSGAVSLSTAEERELFGRLAEIDQLLYELSMQLERASSDVEDRELTAMLHKLEGVASSRGQRFVAQIEQRLAAERPPQFDALEIGDLVRGMNDTLVVGFEELGPQIARRVTQRERRYFREMMVALGLAVGTAGLMLYAFLGLSRSVTRTVFLVQTATREMISGTAGDLTIPTRDELAEVGRHFCLINDALVRSRQMRQQLQVESEAARAASRAKSEFLATMSHEIRTPLNAILGSSNLLLEESLSDDERELASTIRSSGQALLAIVNDVLDMSKLDARQLMLHTGPINVRLLVDSVIAIMAIGAREKDVALVARIDERLPAAFLGDEARVRQVLVNLASNALKFTDRGRIELAAEKRDDDVRGPRLVFRVSDTGCGIPDSELENIFEPFTQVDSSTTRTRGGTGLGLAICKRLLETMNGSIEVSSRFGHGSTFVVDLPLEIAVETRALDPGIPEAARRDDSAGGLRVLLVEDNPVNRKIAIRMLERAGSRPDIATDGLEAVQAAARRPFDLILMDVSMPNLDGLEATRRIRAFRTEHVPRIVGLTAHAFEEDRRACLAAGMDDVLTKPVSPGQLAAVIRETALLLRGEVVSA